jgi:hypothetical protein
MKNLTEVLAAGVSGGCEWGWTDDPDCPENPFHRFTFSVGTGGNSFAPSPAPLPYPDPFGSDIPVPAYPPVGTWGTSSGGSSGGGSGGGYDSDEDD